MMEPYIKYAIYLLEKRDYSRKDLIKKIAEKYPEEQAEKAADYCEERRYIDDLRYARRLWERYSEKYGEKRIREELYKRGIDRETAQQVEEEMTDREKEWEKTALLLRQKMRNRPFSDKKEENKIYAFLARKGFSSEIIGQVIREYKEDSEQYDEE